MYKCNVRRCTVGTRVLSGKVVFSITAVMLNALSLSLSPSRSPPSPPIYLIRSPPIFPFLSFPSPIPPTPISLFFFSSPFPKVSRLRAVSTYVCCVCAWGPCDVHIGTACNWWRDRERKRGGEGFGAAPPRGGQRPRAGCPV